MNERITFFKKEGGQNEDGEVISAMPKDIFTCWTEVKRNKIKDFQEKSQASNGVDGLVKSKDTKTFLIRHYQKGKIDNTMFVRFRGREYQIIAIEEDFANKDIDIISAVRIL